MNPPNEATSPVAWITGAAGGLGRALVRAFAGKSWRVVAAFHNSTEEKETETVWPVPLDVTDRDRVREVGQEILTRWGRIDALINNAGLTNDHPIWQMHDEDWERVLEVNLTGAWLCSQAVVRPMLKQRSGHIVNLSSFAARHGSRGQAGYAAAKAGLIGLTQSIARELGSRNIRVNAVLPGVMATPMTAGLDAVTLEQFATANTLGRLNSVDEVAEFIVFLTSTQNISGQVFQLDSRIARWT